VDLTNKQPSASEQQLLTEQPACKMGLLREQSPDVGILLGKAGDLVNWSRKSSMWWMAFGLACCAIESLMCLNTARFDMDRYGMFLRNTPRQSDLMLVAGTVTHKMADITKHLYEQMPEPRYVIAVGSCAINGGPFYYDSYNVVRGVDKIIPVDVYVPGCPPRPEAVMYGLEQLKAKIMARGKID